ncbi:MAG: Cof-type HAD-IIB family hydrolase [Limosilactobacillus sp.]|uniref:Cof-type HAD-IIB family hydrolase n=1 Tax=Limosilactobacillus sp. TaxID=2773925 RepID=UPI00270C95FA|nr:Cof-type HAD-IIB family hydrolase [Limosilactobacillus sp.]
MEQHLIALDLDGTTLNNESALTDTTIKTLRAAAKEGHIVSIITGRPYRIAQHIYDQIGIKTPMVNFNGALTHIPHEDWSKEYQVQLTRELALDLLDHQEELGIKTITVEDKFHVWANHASDKLPEFLPDHLDEDQILNNKNLTEDPIALTIEYEDGQENKIVKAVNEKYGDFVEPRVWGGSYNILELIHRGTHKESGMFYIAKQFGINKENTIAFGDEHNDFEMLEAAGRGVAMQNAIPDLKKVADDVTSIDNDHDGLAKYLQDYFKLSV